jgi:site-specific DNA-adenine methylase
MTYPGGKNGAGAYQRIINHMPPHETYIECFLGSVAVLRHKRPATRNIGIDRSPEAINLYVDCRDDAHRAEMEGQSLALLDGDALTLLSPLKTLVSDSLLIDQPDTLIYADPPYMMETRKSGAMYDYEMDDAAHERLLEILTQAHCMVMISGYRSERYDKALSALHTD